MIEFQQNKKGNNMKSMDQHVTFQVEGLPPITDTEVVNDPGFDRNRTLMQAAQVMFADSSLTSEQRAAAQSLELHYALKNIREFDPRFSADITEVGDDHLLEPDTDDELLLESSTTVEELQLPEEIPSEDTEGTAYVKSVLSDVNWAASQATEHDNESQDTGIGESKR